MFRAMIALDAAAFLRGLEELHAGAVGRMNCVVFLCKIAQQLVRHMRGPLGSCFSTKEAEVLWQRFAVLDRALQVDEPYLVPGFQTKEPTTYHFNEMPEMDVDGFIAKWSA